MEYTKPEIIIVDLTDEDSLIAAARCSGAWKSTSASGCVS